MTDANNYDINIDSNTNAKASLKKNVFSKNKSF
jgi:hypothetical protein